MWKFESGHKVDEFQRVSFNLLQTGEYCLGSSFTVLYPEDTSAIQVVKSYIPRTLVTITLNFFEFPSENIEAVQEESRRDMLIKSMLTNRPFKII